MSCHKIINRYVVTLLVYFKLFSLFTIVFENDDVHLFLFQKTPKVN